MPKKKKKNKKGEAENNEVGTLEEGKRRKRGKRKKKGFLVVFLIMLTLIIVGGVILYFLGFLDPLLPIVGLPPRSERVTFEQRQEQLIALEKELEVRIQEVTEREEKAAKKEQKLKELEEMLDVRENTPISFNDKIKETDEEKLKQLKKVSGICNTMPPEDAGKILIELESVDEMSLVIYFMNEDAAALLLAALPEITAARILAQIMD